MTPIPDPLTIRIADDHELEDTVRLRWAWGMERGDTGSFTEQSFVAEAAGWARAHADSHIPHVAVIEDRLVGMAWLALTPRVASMRGIDRLSGDLQACYVLPEHRGSGIGGRLVEAVLLTARNRGAEHVTVHSSPAATPMYARHGFSSHTRLLWSEGAIPETSGDVPRPSR